MSVAVPPPPRTRRWRAASRDFALFWAGQTISQLGSEVSYVAVPLVAALVLRASPLEFGLLTMGRTLPWLFASLPAGALVDRTRRRPLLIRADVFRAVAVGLIPLAYLTGTLSFALLFAVVLATGAGSVLFDVGYQSFLPTVVGRSELVRANARLETTRSAAQIVGPGIGGLLVGLLTAPVAMVVDALSFLASILSLGAMRTVEPAPEERAPGVRAALADIAEGLRVVVRDRRLRSIAAASATLNFSRAAWSSLVILFAVEDLGLDPLQIGLMYAAGSLAAIGGAQLTGPAVSRLGLRRTLFLSMLGVSGFALLVPAATPATGFLVLCAAYAGMDGIGIVWDIANISLRQTITGDRLMGRVNASMRFAMFGLAPTFGALLGGVLGTVLTLPAAIAIGAALGMASVLWVLALPRTDLETPID